MEKVSSENTTKDIIFHQRFQKYWLRSEICTVSKAKVQILKAAAEAVTASEVLQFCMRPLFDYIFNFYYWIRKKFSNSTGRNPPVLCTKDVK